LKEIYFDNAATTRTDPEIAAVALELMTGDYGNPASLHGKGYAALARMNEAKKQVAALMGCAAEEVVFTSGGTEANNLAIIGGATALQRRGKHVVTTAYEHSSVMATAKHLENSGFEVSYVKPSPEGLITADDLAEAVREDTILVSCMLVNSETGAIAPIADAAKKIRRKNKLCLIHCDAVQAFGKIPVSARSLGADLITVSAHKIHAPKGCGALYVRKDARKPEPMLHGGEKGLIRPGTANTPLACAFGAAAEMAKKNMAANLKHVEALREHFENKSQTVDGLCINSPEDSTPYIVNLSVPGSLSAHMINALSSRGIYVSGGSACSGGAPSHVLKAMGLAKERIDGAIRVSFSHHNSVKEIDQFFAALEEVLREIKPGRK
jgi:cysteine desulfurase